MSDKPQSASADSLDVLIVGAGPAGLAAAFAAAERGASVRVLDEYPIAGGRLLGQLHREPDGKWWNGLDEAQALVSRAVQAGAVILTDVSVTALESDGAGGWTVWTSSGTMRVRCVLLATGAAESPLPVPGWTLPGVMSIGAAQVMTNVQRVRPGDKGVVIGMNVLAMAIVAELRLAEIELAAIVLPLNNRLSGPAGEPRRVLESLLRFAHLAPSPIFRMGAPLMRLPQLRRLVLAAYPKRGMRLLGTPLQLRRAAVEIVGTAAVEGVRTVDVTPNGASIPGSERFIPADFVCIAGGLYPLAELAAVAGCPFIYLPELGGHVPVHDERMRTPLAGLYVAGNITGVESAKVAIAQGTVAGLAIAADLEPASSAVETELTEAVRNVRQTRDKALIQFHPDISSARQRLYGH